MTRSNGRRGNLYEQVLEYARREIDEASSKTDELRRTLRLLEARVEAAKSVYEAVAARLNLEDELEEEGEYNEAPYPDVPPPLQDPEPAEEADADGPSGNGSQSGFSMDLIRQHLEGRSEREEEVGTETSEEAVSSEPDMDLIRQHLKERSEREEEVGAEEPDAPASSEPGMGVIRQHLEERSEREEEVGTESPARPEPSESISGFPGLSEEDRRLIGEHLQRRAESEREG